MKKPYTSPAGCHRHKCDRCGYVWEHADACRGDVEAHRCPGCESLDLPAFQYHGPDEPEGRANKKGAK